jgi:hypothetical protein
METTLYHWTDAGFDRFEIAYAGSGEHTSTNSNLGIWFYVAAEQLRG